MKTSENLTNRWAICRRWPKLAAHFFLICHFRQKFPNDEKVSEYFMAYEATKVFTIWKMKTQFTNKNTNILRTDILLREGKSGSAIKVENKALPFLCFCSSKIRDEVNL
jgi:hypothetical protein